MITALILAVTVAVAQPEKVTFLQIPGGRQLVFWPIPGRISGLFAAPDGAVWVPLTDQDRTVILRLGFPAEMVEGRYVPLFFREGDRFYAFFPQELVMLANPERVVIDRWPLPPLPGVRFANCSPDGRVVALLTSETPPHIRLVFPFLGETTAVQAVPEGLAPFKFALGSLYLAVAGKTAVALSQLGGDGFSLGQVPGELVDLVFSADEKDLYVLAASPTSKLYRLPTPKKVTGSLSVKAIWQGNGQPKAMAWCREGVLVLESGKLHLVHPRGKAVYSQALEGGTALAVLREESTSSVPR
ncbi:MAG: hypothetical protein ACUVRY_06610 [Thermoanaerobaculaceae bacterium]